MKITKKLLLLAFVALLIGAAGAVVYKEYVIPSTGIVKTAELNITWLDGTQVTEIKWGEVENGTESKLPDLVNITNIGNQPVMLSLTPLWEPPIISVLLGWNYTDTVLSPNSYVIVELYLTITTTESTFSHEIIFTATES